MKRREWIAALSVVAFALALRLLGIRLGLPYYHHWDEGWITDSAAHMAQTPAWEPRVYQYGAPLPWLIALTLRVCSFLWPTRAFESNDGLLLHVVGRYWTALISASGALATYFAARWATVGDRRAHLRGVFAALVYAGAAELVSHGRYAVTDACLVALVGWSLAFGALYVRGGRLGSASLMVAFAATAVAFKISGAPALVIPAVLLAWRRPAGPRWLAWTVRFGAIPFAAVVFFALNPHFILHAHNALGDINTRVHQYEHGGVPEFLVRRQGFDHLAAIAYLMTFQVFHRWPFASAVLAGVSYAGLARALRRSKAAVAGALHAAAVIFGLAITSRAFLVRNYLVAVPILCVGFGFAVEWIADRLSRPIARMALVGAFAGPFVLVPLGEAVENQLQSVDQRVRAVDWIAARAGSKRVTVACTPGIARDSSSDDRADVRADLARSSIAFVSDVPSPADVAASRPDYVLDVSQPDVFGRGVAWKFVSLAGYREVARFDANPWEHNFAITPTWMGRFDVIVFQRE